MNRLSYRQCLYKQARIIEHELRRAYLETRSYYFLIDYIICYCIFDFIFDYIICDCIYNPIICDCIFDNIIRACIFETGYRTF